MLSSHTSTPYERPVCGTARRSTCRTFGGDAGGARADVAGTGKRPPEQAPTNALKTSTDTVAALPFLAKLAQALDATLNIALDRDDTQVIFTAHRTDAA